MTGIIIVYAGILLISIGWAIEDVLQYKHSSSIFRDKDPFSFWGKDSWVRKYKNGNWELGPKFWGSTTFLVVFTDGWHLVKAIYIFLLFIVIMLGDGFTLGMEWYWNLLEAFVMFIIYGAVFELFYKFILRK